MRKTVLMLGVAMLIGVGSRTARAHKAHEGLPAGPIHERHELMEGIGKSAKAIGDAMKTHKNDVIAAAAEKIHVAAGKVTGLFPKDSTHPKSRAKPEIWAKWAEFEKSAKQLEAHSAELAAAAKTGGDVGAAAKTMFGDCKGCHDQFRTPEKDEK